MPKRKVKTATIGEGIPAGEVLVGEVEVEETRVPEVATAQELDIMSLVRPDGAPVIVEREVEIGGHKQVFGFKRLSFKERNQINAKRYRLDGRGKPTLDVDNQDTATTALTLQMAVYRVEEVGGKKEYHQLWTLEELTGTPGTKNLKGQTVIEPVPGLLDDGREEVELLIYTLLAHVWEVNPSTNPFKMAMAQSALGL